MSDAQACGDCGEQMIVSTEDYEYVECGLRGIVLHGVEVSRCECGYYEVEIGDVREVHRRIAAGILESPGPYSAEEARFVSLHVCSGVAGWPWTDQEASA